MAQIGAGSTYTSFLIPARVDGTGKTRLTTSRGTAEHFQLWTIPRSTEASPPAADGGRAGQPTRGANGGGQGYRIAYPAPETRRGYRLARFRLKKGSTQQALVILCNHLDSTGVPWLWLTNKHGGRLSKALFHSKNHTLGA